jgi:hypothetical protein
MVGYCANRGVERQQSATGCGLLGQVHRPTPADEWQNSQALSLAKPPRTGKHFPQDAEFEQKSNEATASFATSAGIDSKQLAGDKLKLTERMGFEPMVGCDTHTDLANRRFRPLSHLSSNGTSDRLLLGLSACNLACGCHVAILLIPRIAARFSCAATNVETRRICGLNGDFDGSFIEPDRA